MFKIRPLLRIAAVSAAAFAAQAHATVDCAGTITQYYTVLGATPPQFSAQLSVGQGFVISANHPAYKEVVATVITAQARGSTVIVTFLGSPNCSSREYRNDVWAIFSNAN